MKGNIPLQRIKKAPTGCWGFFYIPHQGIHILHFALALILCCIHLADLFKELVALYAMTYTRCRI